MKIKEGKSSEPTYAKNKAELARIIGSSRVSIDAWLKLPGCPKPLSNGKFVIAEWRAFKATRKLDAGFDESQELKLIKQRNEAAQSTIDLMKSAEEAIPVAWCEQLFAHLALHKTQIDLCRIGFGDPLEQRTLLDAVTAPNAAVDKNLHLPFKAGKQLPLRRVEPRDVVDLRPAALLLLVSSRKILLVRKRSGELKRKRWHRGSGPRGWK